MPVKKAAATASKADWEGQATAWVKNLICWPMKTTRILATLGGHGWQKESFTSEQLAFMHEKIGTPDSQWEPSSKSKDCWMISEDSQDLRKEINRILEKNPLSREDANRRLKEKSGFPLHRDGNTMALGSSPEPIVNRADTVAFRASPEPSSARSGTGLSSVAESPGPLVGTSQTTAAAVGLRSDWSDEGEEDEDDSMTPNERLRHLTVRLGKIISTAPPTKEQQKTQAELNALKESIAVSKSAGKTALTALFAGSRSTNKSETPPPVERQPPPPAARHPPPPLSSGSIPPPPPPPQAGALWPQQQQVVSGPPAAPEPAPTPAPAPESVPESVPAPESERQTRSKSKAAQEPAAAPPSGWSLGSATNALCGVFFGTSGQSKLGNVSSSEADSSSVATSVQPSPIPEHGPPAATSDNVGAGIGDGATVQELTEEIRRKAYEIFQKDQALQAAHTEINLWKQRVTNLQKERQQLENDLQAQNDTINTLNQNMDEMARGSVDASVVSNLQSDVEIWRYRYEEAEGERQQQRKELGDADTKYWTDMQAKDDEIEGLKNMQSSGPSTPPISRAQFKELEDELTKTKRELDRLQRTPSSSTSSSVVTALTQQLKDADNEMDRLTRELRASQAKVTNLETSHPEISRLTKELTESQARVASLERAAHSQPHPSPFSTTLPSRGEAELQKKLDDALNESKVLTKSYTTTMTENRKLKNTIIDLEASVDNAPQPTAEISRLKSEIVDLRRSLDVQRQSSAVLSVSSMATAPSRSHTVSSFVTASSSISSSVSASTKDAEIVYLKKALETKQQILDAQLANNRARSGKTSDEDIARYQARLAAKATHSTRR